MNRTPQPTRQGAYARPLPYPHGEGFMVVAIDNDHSLADLCGASSISGSLGDAGE